MSTQRPQRRAKFNILGWQKRKQKRQPITVMTAYDYTSAQFVDRAGIDAILVGDSLNMVMLGHDSTVSLTLDEMLHHCKAVARGATRPFLIGDMPFMSFQADPTEAVRNAGRLLKEGGMDAVKLEGGGDIAPTVGRISRAGIPVMGHIGLTPQRISQIGGYRTQGRTAERAAELIEDAKALEAAGCFSIVLEKIPEQLATLITETVNIPTIGIGASAACDGQVLVFHDALGLFDDFHPKHVKRFAEAGQAMVDGLAQFKAEVETRAFPSEAQVTPMANDEWQRLLEQRSSDSN